ncbi:MAG: CHAT domain-containing protein, partial [Gemmatimonadales bacterium]
MLLSLLLILQAQFPGAALAGHPAATLTWAESRAEAPGPSHAADSLRAILRTRPEDPAARLALGTLERLRGRIKEARADLGLLAGRGADAWASAALTGLAYLEREHGSYIRADSLFRAAADRARLAHDRALATEAAIGLAAMAFRRNGPGAALAVLDSAPPPVADARLVSRWHCERSFYTPYAGLAEESAADVAIGRRAALMSGLRGRDALCQIAAAHLLANSAAPAAWIPLLDSAEATSRAFDDPEGRAFIGNFRGFQALLAYDHSEASARLRVAAAVADSAGLPVQRAWARRHLGHLAWHLGDLPLAERELGAAIADLEAYGDDFGVIAAEMARVGVLTELGRLSEARQGYERGRAYAARTGMHVFGAWAELGLAALDLRAGNPLRARATFEFLQQSFAASGLTTVARGLEYDIGRAALAAGDFAEAERRFRRHLAPGGEISPLDRFSARARLAEVHAGRGEFGRAAGELEAATDELEALRASRTEPQLRLLAFQTKKGNDEGDLGFARLFHQLATGRQLERAWLLAERRRARELTDRILSAGGSPDARRAARTLEEVRRELGKRNAALLAFVTGEGDQPTTAVLVSAGGMSASALPPISRVAALLAQVTEDAEFGGADAVMREAGRSILPPGLENLPADVRTLVIVDDQGLHRVPFDLLRLPSGAAVVERFAVVHAPSATLLLALWEQAPKGGGGGLLAIGDPYLPTGSDGAIAEALYRGGDTLGRLPGSAREARLVGRYGTTAVVLIGREATEARLKRELLDRFSVIHVASHALVGEEWSSRTAIALSPGDGEDGYLTPAELAALPLAADLVVLSGCRTARGMTVRGEGVLGLTAPLLSAGARSVLATGWDAPDAEMVEVAERFYRELASGLPVGEALHRTKLAIRDQGRPSREWAAFRLTGDPFLMVPLRRPQPARWPLAAAAALLAAGILVATRRRAE